MCLIPKPNLLQADTISDLAIRMRVQRGLVSVLSVAAGSVVVTASACVPSAYAAAAQDAQAMVDKLLGGRSIDGCQMGVSRMSDVYQINVRGRSTAMGS